MTLVQAIARNPFDETKGNLSAYCRFLRYNVDGWYDKSNDEVKELYKEHCKESQE